MKNITKDNLKVHWRTNKKAWMTASMFYDWVKNCCIPELKDYSIIPNNKILISNSKSFLIMLQDIRNM